MVVRVLVCTAELNAWYDIDGEENADKCAWMFGNTYTVGSTAALANVRLGTRDFLLQQNWVNANGGYCSLSYDNPTSATPTTAPTVAVTASASPSPSTSMSPTPAPTNDNFIKCVHFS